jgi:hypothetical protein
MRDLFYLSETQFNRIKPYFPLSMGFPVLTICERSAGSSTSSGMACNE